MDTIKSSSTASTQDELLKQIYDEMSKSQWLMDTLVKGKMTGSLDSTLLRELLALMVASNAVQRDLMSSVQL